MDDARISAYQRMFGTNLSQWSAICRRDGNVCRFYSIHLDLSGVALSGSAGLYRKLIPNVSSMVTKHAKRRQLDLNLFYWCNCFAPLHTSAWFIYTIPRHVRKCRRCNEEFRLPSNYDTPFTTCIWCRKMTPRSKLDFEKWLESRSNLTLSHEENWPLLKKTSVHRKVTPLLKVDSRPFKVRLLTSYHTVTY